MYISIIDPHAFPLPPNSPTPPLTPPSPSPGWLRTGDLARFDLDGFLWFVARRKLIIVRRGSNLAPAAVERWLLEHPKAGWRGWIKLVEGDDIQYTTN